MDSLSSVVVDVAVCFESADSRKVGFDWSGIEEVQKLVFSKHNTIKEITVKIQEYFGFKWDTRSFGLFIPRQPGSTIHDEGEWLTDGFKTLHECHIHDGMRICVSPHSSRRQVSEPVMLTCQIDASVNNGVELNKLMRFDGSMLVQEVIQDIVEKCHLPKTADCYQLASATRADTVLDGNVLLRNLKFKNKDSVVLTCVPSNPLILSVTLLAEVMENGEDFVKKFRFDDSQTVGEVKSEILSRVKIPGDPKKYSLFKPPPDVQMLPSSRVEREKLSDRDESIRFEENGDWLIDKVVLRNLDLEMFQSSGSLWLRLRKDHSDGGLEKNPLVPSVSSSKLDTTEPPPRENRASSVAAAAAAAATNAGTIPPLPRRNPALAQFDKKVSQQSSSASEEKTVPTPLPTLPPRPTTSKPAEEKEIDRLTTESQVNNKSEEEKEETVQGTAPASSSLSDNVLRAAAGAGDGGDDINLVVDMEKEWLTMFSCPVCMGSFNFTSRVPRFLMCKHTICSSCISSSKAKKTSVLSQNGQDSLLVMNEDSIGDDENLGTECPLCKALTVEPAENCPVNSHFVKLMKMYSRTEEERSGTKSLPICDNSCKNVAEFHCVECNSNMCIDCAESVHSLPVIQRQNHTVSPLIDLIEEEENTLRCITHDGSHQLTKYCLSCEDIICEEEMYEFHSRHLDQVVNLKKAIDIVRKDFDVDMKKVREKYEVASCSLKQLSTARKALDDSFSRTKEDLMSTKKRVIEGVSAFFDGLVHDAEGVRNSERAILDKQLAGGTSYLKIVERFMDTTMFFTSADSQCTLVLQHNVGSQIKTITFNDIPFGKSKPSVVTTRYKASSVLAPSEDDSGDESQSSVKRAAAAGGGEEGRDRNDSSANPSSHDDDDVGEVCEIGDDARESEGGEDRSQSTKASSQKKSKKSKIDDHTLPKVDLPAVLLEALRRYAAVGSNVVSQRGADSLEGGVLMEMGTNNGCRLGFNNADAPLKLRPSLVPPMRRTLVMNVALGGGHVLALSDKNELYCWGDNNAGQCATSIDEATVSPHLVESLNKHEVEQIAAGFYHSMCLTKEGKLFSWGFNKYRQLGLKHSKSVSIPTEVDLSLFDCSPSFPSSPSSPRNSTKDRRFLSKIDCGGQFSAALTNDGSLFLWGHNQGNPDSGLPKQIDFKKRVDRFSCGYGHIAFQTVNDSSVYTMGYNRYSQLGLGHTDHQQTPQVVSSLKWTNIIQVECGAAHTMAVSSTYELYSWGYNRVGQLGLSHFDDVRFPTVVSGLKGVPIVRIFPGLGNHSAVLGQDGSVYLFGSNVEGELGIGNQTNVPIPTQHPLSKSHEIETVGVGWNFSAFIIGSVKQSIE